MQDRDHCSFGKKLLRHKALIYLAEIIFLLVLSGVLFAGISALEKSEESSEEQAEDRQYGPAPVEEGVDPVMVPADSENIPRESLPGDDADINENTVEEDIQPGTDEETGGETGKVLFIGDSRTIDMFADSNEELIAYDAGDDFVVYAKHGYGFDYMKGIIDNYGKENFDILVTWMGANDAGYFDKYGSYYDELLQAGVKMIVCTVGPSDDDGLVPADHPNYEDDKMTGFNSGLVEWAEKNDVRVIDLYDYIKESPTISIDPNDGIHYLPRPTTELWDYIVNSIR